MKIKTLIIEDINSTVETLKIMLLPYTEIDLIGTASNKDDAIYLIKSTSPDLILMDIQIGKHTGFEILDACKTFYKFVIFITCHDEYTLKGYEYNTIHYLLKPIDEKQLEIALNKVFNTINLISNHDDSLYDITKFSNTTNKKIYFPDKNIYHSVDVDSIIFIESDSSYSNIYTVNRIIKMSKNLSFIQNMLKDYNEFIRVHRSYIINQNHILNVKKGNDSILKLTNNHTIPISINLKDVLFKKLNIKN
jgi:two-component system LytT family response regulator